MSGASKSASVSAPWNSEAATSSWLNRRSRLGGGVTSLGSAGAIVGEAEGRASEGVIGGGS